MHDAGDHFVHRRPSAVLFCEGISPMANLRFEIRSAAGAQPYYWRIVDGVNVLARSETLHNKSDASEAASKLKYHTSAYVFEVTAIKDPAFHYSWHAQAGN